MPVQLLSGDPEDERLLHHVRPSNWINPTPSGKYNLVVIGAGSAGLVSAAGAAGLGARVALVERELLGGDCLNVGCVPSKALIRAARAAHAVRHAATLGVHVGEVRVDFPAVMARLRRLRADISPHDSAERFRKLGVDVYLGSGHFSGPDQLEVGGQTLTFTRAIIATGARARRPEIPGLAEAGYLTNESVFSLTELPARLAVIGGGPIGCELAQAFARLGSVVTLIHNHDRLLPRDEPRASDLVAAALRRDGVTIHLASGVTQASRVGDCITLTLRNATSVNADRVLVAAGRSPNIEGLGLEAAGVAFTTDGVCVNDYLRTTNPRIFAAGDIASRWQFTHAADAMARIALQNALIPIGQKRVSGLTMPWCTFTDPEVAHVGLSEEQVRQRGGRPIVFEQDLARVDRAILDGESEGFVKVVADRKGRIFGATIVAAHAGEMIAELALAMTAGLGLGRIAGTIHPYPTQAGAIKAVGDAFMRTRLTPLIKSLLDRWLRRMRS